MANDRAVQHLAHAFPGALPIEIASADGAYLVTPDGRRILDAAGGAIVSNVGHGRREVADAYAAAATRLTYVVPPFATEERIRLADRLLSDWLPEGITRVGFTSGGSESMDAAIRLVRQHHVAAGRPERWKVIGRDLSYHGTTLAALASGGHTKRRAGFEPWLPDIPRAPACYCARCPLGLRYPECGVACAEAIERAFEAAGPGTVAAFVAEPIGGSTAGALVPPDEYLPAVAEICRRHGVLLIADEVMTGFGRTGRRFAVDHWNVTPDVLIGGKGLTGGYAPMGGVFATEEVVAPLLAAGQDLMFFTYGAHPATCAAADAVLAILEREALVERAAKMGERLAQRLARLTDHPHVADVRGRGLLQAVELVRDRDTGDPFPAEAGVTRRVVGAALSEGVFFYPGGCDPARDVVVMGPPFIVSEAEIDRMAEVLEWAISSATQRAVGAS